MDCKCATLCTVSGNTWKTLTGLNSCCLLGGLKAPFLLRLPDAGANKLVPFVMSSIVNWIRQKVFVSVKLSMVPCPELT